MVVLMHKNIKHLHHDVKDARTSQRAKHGMATVGHSSGHCSCVSVFPWPQTSAKMLNRTAAYFSPVLAAVTLGLFATSLTKSLLNRFRISREPVGFQTFCIDLNRLRGFGCGFNFFAA